MEAPSANSEPKLIAIPNQTAKIGCPITLSCHLSPECSAVHLEIRWFAGTDCVCLYKNRQFTGGRGYEERVSLFTQELERGNVSLQLKDCRESDIGHYLCQVIDGDRREELTVRVWWSSFPNLSSFFEGIPRICIQQWGRKWVEAERMKMEDSVLLTKHKTCVKSLITELEEKNSALMTTKEQLNISKLEGKQASGELQKMRLQLDEMRLLLNTAHKEFEEKKTFLPERDTKETEQIERYQQSWEGRDPETSDPVRRRNKEQGKNKQEKEENLKSVIINKRNSVEAIPPAMSEEQCCQESLESVRVSDLRLVLLGRTGSGKTEAGNVILVRAETSTIATSKERQQSESRQGEVAGRQVTMVDTPDWFCPGLCLEELRQDVGHCVRLSAPGPHAFLLVLPVKQSTGEERGMLEKMEEIFGVRCWRNTIILFTVTDEVQEKNAEEFIRSGTQEVQRLVEKCGNRFHCLNLKESDEGSQVSELLEKIEEMLEGNRGAFYSSEIYQETESQIRAMEKIIMQEREERRAKQEKQMIEKVTKAMNECVREFNRAIQMHEKDIQTLDVRITQLERKMAEETDDNLKGELQKKLKQNVKQKIKMENIINSKKEKSEWERKEIEERYRREMEEMMEKYEGEARVEAEKNLMKIVLPELQRNIFISASKMQEKFNRQMEEKNREIEALRRKFSELSETHLLQQEVYQSAVMRITESERRGRASEQDQEPGESVGGLKWVFRKKDRNK